MKRRLRDTLLLLEFAFRTILVVWQEPVTVKWSREWKTISLTIHNIRECHICGESGVVLAREVFTWNDPPTWFCVKHWAEFEAIYSLVEDRRTKEATDGHE